MIGYVADVADVAGNMQGSAAYQAPNGSADGQMLALQELGLFIYFSAATDPVDGETCLMPQNGVGRWILVCPSVDLIWSHLYGQELSAVNIRAVHAQVSPASEMTIAAGSWGEFEAQVPGVVGGSTLVPAPGSGVPAGVFLAGSAPYNGSVTVSVFNAAGGAVTLLPSASIKVIALSRF